MDDNFTNLYAVVLHDCNGDDQNELLSTEIGDLMVIHNLVIRDGLTFGYGYIKGEELKTGYVPKQYLNFIDGAEENFINTTFLMLCKKTFNNSMDNILCELMNKGVQINFKGEFGITPLMMACYFNDIELLSFLIGKNAKLDITNEDGDTPLNIATYFNNAEIVKALVKQRPKNLKNIYGESALTIAYTMDDKEIIDILSFHFKVDGEEMESMDASDSSEYYSSFSEKEDYYSSFSEDEEVVEENYIAMDEELKGNTNNTLSKSVCLIKVTCNNNKEMRGTGFLVKLLIPSKKKPLYGLITNDYVLTSEYLQSNSSFEVLLNNKTLKINLNNNKIIFTSELIGITFIQLTKLTDEKFFNDPDIDFLSPDTEKFDAKNDVIIQTQDKSLTFESIKPLSGFNYSLKIDKGLFGSPLLNYDSYSNNLKVLGIYKRGNVATSFNIIEEVIRMIYNKRYIYEINRARENPRVLNDDEIEELINHKLEETKLNNVFKCPYLELNKSVFFYKSNHGWYCTIRKNIKYDKENLKNYDWTFINPYEPIEKIIEKIGKGKLEHRHEVIIMWLKLSEFKYI